MDRDQEIRRLSIRIRNLMDREREHDNRYHTRMERMEHNHQQKKDHFAMDRLYLHRQVEVQVFYLIIFILFKNY